MNVSRTANVTNDATFEILGSDGAGSAAIKINGGSYNVGGTLLAGFAIWQLRAETPLLPTRLLASRPIAAANAATFLMAAALWAVLPIACCRS